MSGVLDRVVVLDGYDVLCMVVSSAGFVIGTLCSLRSLHERIKRLEGRR